MSESQQFQFSDLFSEAVLEGRDLEIVRGVLLCGLSSLNGYSFASNAWGDESNAKRLYEGASIFLDHDFDRGPNRQVKELAGTVANVRLTKAGPRGDLVLSTNSAANEVRALVKLNKRATEAGGKLKHVGISHVARYSLNRERTTVESVLEVLSCDVVVRPATTSKSGLFESSAMSVSNSPPFNAKEALRFINFPELIGAEWNPHKALEALDNTGQEYEKFWRMASPSYNPKFDPEQALTNLSLT